jgi:hypothetical protein
MSDIKFAYDEPSINELKEFCGDSFVGTQKSRHMSAVGYATIIIDDKLTFLQEGDWLVKTNGKITRL